MSTARTTPAPHTLMSACAAALGGQEFLAAVLSREFHRARVDPGRAAAELGWQVVDEILSSATFEPNMIRLTGPDGRIEPATYTSVRMGGGQIVERSLAAAPFHRALADGATLVVNKADRLHRSVRVNRERLEYFVAETAWCNAYATWSDSSAFGRHTDDHDVIVVQAEGTKDWVVLGPVGDDDVRFEGTLEPGDVLHLPRGWQHQVTGRGGPSLHWTFGFRRPTAVEILCEAVSRSAVGGSARWDQDGLLSAADRTGVHSLLEGAGDRIESLTGTAWRAAKKERRDGSSLPWSVSTAPWDTAGIRWAARLPPVVNRVGESAVVATLGREYRLDGRLEPVLRALQPGEPVAVPDLCTASGLGLEVLAGFLRFALREEIIIAERLRGPAGGEQW